MSENLDVEIPWPGWRVVSRLGHGTYGSVWEIERDVAGDSERGALKVILDMTRGPSLPHTMRERTRC